MSFRLYVYYCAVFGGWAALVGFALGMVVAPANLLGSAGILGMFFGMTVAFVLGLLDGLWDLTHNHLGLVLARALTAAFVGTLAGLLGGILAHVLRDIAILSALGWMLAGMLIGTSIAVFEIVAGLVQQSDITPAKRKLQRSALGGALGGVLGGILSLVLGALFSGALRDRDPNWLWSPRAMGFAALGMAIGLMVALAQSQRNKVG